MPDDLWELHFRTDDKVVHLADRMPLQPAWCTLRCDDMYQYQVSQGEIVRPVTCMNCLALR